MGASPTRSATPELPGRQSGAFHERFELGPRDLRVTDPRPEAAVRPGDHVLASDQTGVPDDPLGDELRVLDEIARVADHAGDQDLAVRKLHVFPHAPFVLVARV